MEYPDNIRHFASCSCISINNVIVYTQDAAMIKWPKMDVEWFVFEVVMKETDGLLSPRTQRLSEKNQSIQTARETVE